MTEQQSIDVDLVLTKRAPVRLVDSQRALADVTLDTALGARGRRVLQRERGSVTILHVPTAQWIDPVAKAAARVVCPNTLFVAKNKSADLASHIAHGGNIVGVAVQSGDNLPILLHRVATEHFFLDLDVDQLRQVMARCLIGKAPPELRELDLSRIDLDVLCALMPLGGKKSESVRRIAELTPSRLVQPTGGLILPKLADAHEYGAAREWGLELAQDIRDYKAGIIAWHHVPRGAVLTGPPGTGKTTLAKLLAEACEVPLIHGSVAEFFAATEGHLNDVVKAQRQLFARAEAAAPAILFLDEINAYPSPNSMSGSRNRDYWMPLVNDFYMLLDSAMSHREGVVVVGATNRIEDIAPQLLRPGRLERSIEIAAPSALGLVNILRTHLQGDLKDEDLLPLAVLAEGATAAIAMEWVRSARRLARRAQRAMVFADLETQVFGLDPRTPSDLFRAAVHEAGHAIVGRLEGLPALSVSIRKIGATGGRTVFGERPMVMTQSDCSREVRMTLAGRAAERILLRETSSGSGGGAQSDLATATGMVAAMVGAYGFSSTARWAGAPRDLLATLSFDGDLRKQVTADLKKLDLQTHAIVRRFRHEIAQLAEELVLKRTVDLA